MNKVFEDRERKCAGGIDDSCSGSIPTSSIPSRSLSVWGNMLLEREAPDDHLTYDTVVDTSQHRFNDLGACVGIKQIYWSSGAL